MEPASNQPQASHEVEILPHAVLIRLYGEFDLVTEQALASWLIDTIEAHPGQTVEVDMDEVSFLDSSGIRVLLRARDAAAKGGGVFRLTRASGTVKEVLDIVDAYDYLTGADSTDVSSR